VSKVFIRKMVECDLAEVSELALLANPHAVKEDYFGAEHDAIILKLEL
jgi:hypothetical protein